MQLGQGLDAGLTVELVILAVMPGVDAQLQLHLNMGRNTGLPENQLVQVAGLIEQFVSRTQANVLRKLLNRPISPLIEPDTLVCIAELEIASEHLEEYKAILTTEAAASVKPEPGVLAIFPMYQKENPS